MEFIILDSQNNESQKIVFYFTANSLFDNLKFAIEKLKKNKSKELILLTGNIKKYFLVIFYKKNKLNIELVSYVTPPKYCQIRNFRQLFNNFQLVKNSILAIEQKQKILKGNIFYDELL